LWVGRFADQVSVSPADCICGSIIVDYIGNLIVECIRQEALIFVKRSWTNVAMMQVPNLCTWPSTGQVAEGEDEVLKILAPSSEFTLTVNILMNAVRNALERGKNGVMMPGTSSVTLRTAAFRLVGIHAMKDSVGENGWYEDRSMKMLK